MDTGLAGAMFWTLDFDDFGSNVCNQGSYPLIGRIGTALQIAGPLGVSFTGESTQCFLGVGFLCAVCLIAGQND